MLWTLLDSTVICQNEKKSCSHPVVIELGSEKHTVKVVIIIYGVWNGWDPHNTQKSQGVSDQYPKAQLAAAVEYML